MGLVTFLMVSNYSFHTAKEQSSQFFICIYSLLMHLVQENHVTTFENILLHFHF